MKNWIFNNFWIKMLSLILAIITWFYANGELVKQKRVRSRLYKPPTIEQPADQPSLETKQIDKTHLMERK